MRQLLPDVLTWSWFSEPHGYDFNGTLFLHEAGNLCVDPVPPSDEVLDRLEEEGVAQILITNRNHTRASNLVAERTGAQVAIHPADAPHALEQGTHIDAALEVGQRIGPFTVIGVPGKSPGEIALHDPARGILVVGDAVIGNPPGALSFLPDRVIDDPARLRASVRALIELEFDGLIVGDGVSILEGAKAKLRELVSS
ncbi:MAG: MBL fold metallo-hydrolase [Myxococcales bacterium]|nr:MBL fold metallo-hydrolase [Myxococcales bacterium]